MSDFKYTPDPEFTALAARYRERDRAALVARGMSADLADLYLDKRDEAISRAVVKAFMEGTQPEGATGGLLNLLRDGS